MEEFILKIILIRMLENLLADWKKRDNKIIKDMYITDIKILEV